MLRGFKSRPLRCVCPPERQARGKLSGWRQHERRQPFAFSGGSGIIFAGRARWGASGAFAACAAPEIRLCGVEFPYRGPAGLSLLWPSGVEDRVLRGRSLRTPPGPEGSNGKEILLGAAGAPDWSWLAGKSQAAKFDEGCTTIPHFYADIAS